MAATGVPSSFEALSDWTQRSFLVRKLSRHCGDDVDVGRGRPDVPGALRLGPLKMLPCSGTPLDVIGDYSNFECIKAK